MGLFRHILSAAAVFPLLFLWSAPSGAKVTTVRTFSALQTLVEENHVRSVEELIPLLDFDLRRNYSFVTLSRSTQSATLLQPRVNLIASDVPFILAYAGDPSFKGGNTIETIHLAPGDREFQFGQIAFTADGPKFQPPGTITSCFGCHSSHAQNPDLARMVAHPIWDSYPDWPDRYGASHMNYRGRGVSLSKPSPRLDAGLKAFQEFALDHPRYRDLIDLQGMDAYSLGEKNSDLGNSILQSTLMRAARNIVENPLYPTYAKAFGSIRVFQDENSFLAMLPPADRAEFLSQKPDLIQEAEELRAKYYAEKVRRYSYNSGLPSILANARPSFAEWVALEAQGNLLAVPATMTKGFREWMTFILRKMSLPPELLNLTLEHQLVADGEGSTNLETLGAEIDRVRVRPCENLLSRSYGLR